MPHLRHCDEGSGGDGVAQDGVVLLLVQNVAVSSNVGPTHVVNLAVETDFDLDQA